MSKAHEKTTGRIIVPLDLLNMAKYYNVCLTETPNLLPLIKQAVETPLPPNWIEIDDTVDEDERTDTVPYAGAPLYMNELSGVVQREHPADAYFRSQIQAHRRNDGRRDVASAWLEFRRENNESYFYDFATNTQQDEFPLTGLVPSATHVQIPKEVFERAAEIHRQPKSKSIDRLDILCFHAWWHETCDGAPVKRYADIYFSIRTKHFQFVLGNSEHVYTISHINGRDSKPLEAWDLHIGAKITILGRPTSLMKASMLTLQWLESQEKQLRAIQEKLSTELKKYNPRHSDTKYKPPIESPEIRLPLTSPCLRALRDEVAYLRESLAKFRPDLAGNLTKSLHLPA
ncbi:hypothetical protein SPRG_08814 [Saprolegnia parasitica CBS 223.65]|uniref:WW domain-containing protein n=1 Tax=Saprolegnia parasitica (strain CBS 223.65) TaxID=695850 RepID=A0A067CH50_SAPPC|nr:hypothetical protein SPRG_08814 [Saprolegnia parasitica CBS 223.65]KDO25871.1 hypothetical protein SPRG_08814 [Saprolegnia parasitica CBS 223.65]|eukprot:XP_012203433.1 hypothetical protein SPRG_08814 [Saprolegnia parasitica CBS 223.65]